MGIKFDNSKPKFNIMEWEIYFEKKGYSVPQNEIDFRTTMRNTNISIKFVSDKIMEATNWDSDDLDEECPDKTSKIDKFLELYDVVFPTAKVEEIPVITPLPNSPVSLNILEISTELMDIDEAQDFLEDNHSKLVKDVDGKISVKAPVLVEKMPITVNSNFRIKYSLENISRINVLIIDSFLENVVAVGKIIDKEGSNLILFEKCNIDYKSFENKTQFNIALLRVKDEDLTGEIIYKPINIHMKKIETTDKVLCIDFGTSNTTVGSYRIKDEFGTTPELVTFADVTKNNQLVNYFPTVVYVENCENPNRISYKFGFEAKMLEKTRNYESLASVFYQIKHWLIEDSCYSEKISIYDSNGNTTEVEKKDIVCAYLKHIIELSEDYFSIRFKELHFTTPVKMKYKFIKILREILTDYNIVEDGIDEAGAILFDYVADKFDKWNSDESNIEDSGNVAVIDCGGGTTDLASCKYKFIRNYDDLGISEIEMNTQFTNGDFNYGGNNITYRIMQLIKLKIALKYGFISEDEFNKVLERSENDILLDADKNDFDSEKLYKEYISLYNRCEEFIPTKFNEISDDLFDDDVPKIKRNFYYLWQFAEQTKIIFYREEKEVKKENWDDAIQTIGDISLNYLYQKVDSSLKRIEHPFDELPITITEIRKVIFGDIYGLLNRILKLEDGLPNPVYEYYRLSGQSCKINLFNELLKEFIPGKRLRAKMERNIEHMESLVLKKHCINGSIRYIMHKRLNMHSNPKASSVLAERIYSLWFCDLSNEEPAESTERKTLIFYPIKSSLDEITVLVKNTTSIVRKINVSTKIDKNYATITNPDVVIKELRNGNSDIDWNETCSTLAKIKDINGEAVFIVAVPSGDSDGYGFYIHFIKKIIDGTKETYKVTKGKYYNYEATYSDYFDGKR